MNLNILWRAVQRHRHMQDAPAYEALLQQARNSGDTWMVPQAELARWWEARQGAALRMRFENGRVYLSCDLSDAAVQIDDGEPVPLPTVLDLSGAQGSFRPTYPVAMARGPFWLEVIRHLGYGHLVATETGEGPTLSRGEIEPLLTDLHAHALKHQRFEPELLARIRDCIVRAHGKALLPDLRLWHWPVGGGRPFRAALSVRYDVDKAIVTMPWIHELEDRYGLRSTVYLRPMGLFYGGREIRHYRRCCGQHELALHGEFITTAEQRFGDERTAAAGEKSLLEEMTGAEVSGVCMHGGELRTNTSTNTRDAVESAGFVYETMYRNRYHFPLHLPFADGMRQTLSIGQHFADISVPLNEEFTSALEDRFREHYEAARAVNGVFVPVMHPLYFGVGRYLSHPVNVWRMACFVPRFLSSAMRMRSKQSYSNV